MQPAGRRAGSNGRAAYFEDRRVFTSADTLDISKLRAPDSVPRSGGAGRGAVVPLRMSGTR
jgi:hypothetical protein